MIYLIGQLAGWLLLAAAFAAIAGWSFAAYRAAAEDDKARRDRAGIVRSLNALVNENAHPEESLEAEREREAARRMANVREGRVAELERALEAARASADESQARIAELERALEVGNEQHEPIREIAMDVQPARLVDESDDDPNLQSWRLRYFEQRVRYLEGPARQVAPSAPTPISAPPLHLWRARVAEARAAHAENAIRALLEASQAEQAYAPDTSQASPFAANADTDMLLRWRMLYLERRAAHMQARAVTAPARESAQEAESPIVAEADRWMWRARYLESRARRLEQRLSETSTRPAAAFAPRVDELEPDYVEPPARLSTARRVKPPMLQAARAGAPDDFTLIEGVSLLQQTTLYSLGVFHYEQIAAWSDEHVAWIDHYLRLRGRIDDEAWREQADALAREGPAAVRRALAEEDA